MFKGFALSAVITVVVLVVVLISLRKSGVFGMSKKKQLATQLAATGTKARAWIVAIQPTGTVVNMINIQCDVAFRLEPLAGGQPFDVQKRMLLSQTAMPRIGDCWPSWFDPTDPSQFAVGQPTAMTPEAIATLREFGIPTPFDPPKP